MSIIAPAKPLSIVVLEDDQPTATMYRALLEEEGFRVDIFSDTAQCRRFVRERQPDLLIFDVIGEGEDGLSLLASLQDELGAALPPAIIATGLAYQAIQHHPAMRYVQCLRTMQKPFGVFDLLDTVTELAQSR